MYNRCLAAGLRMTFASSALTPRELSWQWLDSKACVVFVYPDLVQVVKAMFKLVNVSEKEADRRIWIMDKLWDENLPKGDYATEQWLGQLLHKGELSAEEKFDGDRADETAYICYSSGTTVRHFGSLLLNPFHVIFNAGKTEGSGGKRD